MDKGGVVIRFEEALRQELISIPALGSRVYPLFSSEAVAKNGVPYLIYKSSEGLREKDLQGYQSNKEVDCELNVVSPRYEEMKSIVRAVIDMLISFELRAIGTSGPFIQEVTYEQPVELYEPQPKLYRCNIEVKFYFDEGA